MGWPLYVLSYYKARKYLQFFDFFPSFFSPKHPAGKQNYFSNAKGIVSISSAGQKGNWPGHARRSPTSYTLLCPWVSCLPLWNQQSILYQQGLKHALKGREGGIVWYYQHNRAIWGTEGSPACLFSTQTVHHIMCGNGHFKVTVFSITTDEKGKAILFPFSTIIGTHKGVRFMGFEQYPSWSTCWQRLGER